MKLVFSLTIIAGVGIVNAAREIDRISKLPGYADSSTPSTHYSGCKI